jgi:hypothetical protein
MMAAFGRHRESGVAASLTENGRGGEAALVGFFSENGTRNLCPFHCPKRCGLRPNDAILPY